MDPLHESRTSDEIVGGMFTSAGLEYAADQRKGERPQHPDGEDEEWVRHNTYIASYGGRVQSLAGMVVQRGGIAGHYELLTRN